MAQDLGDILGKSGDFQLSFSVQDMISPAVEHIDKAGHSLMDFFDKQTKKVSTVFDKSNKALLKGFKQAKKEGKRASDTVGDSLGDLGNEAGDSAEEVRGLVSAIKDILQVEQVKGALTDLFSGQISEAAEKFNQDMRDVANTLGRNRTEMVGLTESVLDGQRGQSTFATSAMDGIDAIQGLVEAGVRSDKMLRDLAPTVALVTNAVGGDSGSIAAAFYELDDRMGLTGPQITQVFSSWKRASENTATSFEDMQESLTDPEFFDQFRVLTQGMSSDVQTQMLASIGNIKASFGENWAESDEFITKIMSSLTDPTMAAEMGKMTGMAAHQVKEMLQTTAGTEQFMGNFLSHVQNMAAHGEGALVPMADAFGLSTKNLQQLSEKAPSVLKTFQGLETNVMGAGEAMAFATQRAEENLTMTEKLGNFISTLAGKQIPLLGLSVIDIFDAMADLPFTEMFAFGTMMATIASNLPALATAFPAVAAGIAAVSAEVGLLTSLFGILASAALPLIAKAAVIGGVAYLIYSNFDMIKEKGFQLWDFFMGTGKLEDGWLGTLQALLRVASIPLRVLIAGLGLLTDALVGVVTWVDKVTGFSETLLGLKDAVLEIGSAFGEILSLKWDTWLTGFKEQINSNIIDPLNKFTSVGFGSVTIGSKLGIENIPRLGSGGIAMGPTTALIGEAGQPEVVMPLDRLAETLAMAGYQSAAASVAPAPTFAPRITTDQDRVVRAVEKLTATMQTLLRRTELPTKGSAFARSPGANPRGF